MIREQIIGILYEPIWLILRAIVIANGTMWSGCL